MKLNELRHIAAGSVGYLMLAMMGIGSISLDGNAAVNPETKQQGRGHLYRRLMLPPGAPSKVPPSIEALASDSETERVHAAVELVQVRSAVARPLLDRLRALSRTPERVCMGQFHVAVVVAGRYRLEEAVPILVPLIDFSLDPHTFPVGARYQSQAYYPVAIALSKIGGPAVFESVLANLSKPLGERGLRVSAWVLKETLGPHASRAVVRAALDNASDDQHKRNLSTVLTVLSEEVILRRPE